MEKATQKALRNTLIHQFKLKKDIDADVTNINLPNDYEAVNIVTQNLEEAKSFLNKYSVNYELDTDFDPCGYWIGANINKVKFKWRNDPVQWIDESKNIYSVFNKNEFRVLIGKEWNLCIIPTSNPNFTLCYAYYTGKSVPDEFSKIDLAITQILENIKTSYIKDTNTDCILVPHLQKSFTTLFIPDESEKLSQKNELELKCHKCIDHYRITIDSHGLYINRLSRNKIRKLAAINNNTLLKTRIDYLWIKNINNENVFAVKF